MKINIVIAGLILLISSSANALDIGVGVKAGTVGIGVDISVALTQTINARVSLTSIDVDDFEETLEVGDDSGNEGEIDAVMGLDFGANALLIDWYVFDGTFHVTAGLMKNNGKIDFTGQLIGTNIDLGGEIINPGDIGDITGSISAGESYEPYLGIGWGRKAGDEPGLSLSIELGVALLDPKSELSATISGTGSLTQAEVNDAIQGAEDDVNTELSALEAWPILSFGLNYAF